MSFTKLLDEARELGMDIAEFQALIKFGEEVAATALKKAITLRKRAISQIDHKGLFISMYENSIDALMLNLSTVRDALQQYNAEHEASLTNQCCGLANRILMRLAEV